MIVVTTWVFALHSIANRTVSVYQMLEAARLERMVLFVFVRLHSRHCYRRGYGLSAILIQQTVCAVHYGCPPNYVSAHKACVKLTSVREQVAFSPLQWCLFAILNWKRVHVPRVRPPSDEQEQVWRQAHTQRYTVPSPYSPRSARILLNKSRRRNACAHLLSRIDRRLADWTGKTYAHTSPGHDGI